jgi:NTE family protein
VNATIPAQFPVRTEQETQESKTRYQEKMKEFYAHLQKVNPLHKEEKFGYLNLVSKTINLMIYQIAQLHLEQYNPDIMIEISRESCGTYDFYKAEELVEIGRFATQKALSQQ